MKNKIQLLQFVAILIFSFGSYSQVAVSVQNLQYTNNGQSTVSLSNCGNIDLASSTSTSINLGINLSKPNGQVVGLSDLRVYTKKSSSDSRIERSWAQIAESSWSTGTPNTRSTSASFSINSSDFNASGGTLFVVFKSSGNIEYQTTCSFTISKALLPSFTLSPTSLILACGDTAARTFTVTPANIPAGVTPSYNWSPGVGWTEVGSTTNSRTYQPSFGAFLSSNVSVTPILNGVAQPTMTCTVTRAPFTSTASISGANAICAVGASAIYTINAGSGNTVVWSSSNTAIATVSNATNSQVTLTTHAQGDFILNAVITNPCNETINRSKYIFNIGVPQFNAFTFGDDSAIEVGPDCFITSLQSLVIFADFNGMTSSEIRDNLNWEWEPLDNIIYMNYSGNRGQVVPLQVGTSNFRVRAKNACGWSDWIYYYGFEITECPSSFRTAETMYTLHPNPANDIVNIELKDSKIKPKKEAIVSGTLFDLMGQSRRKVQIKNNSATLSVAGLKKGIYVLNISIDGKEEGHQLIVE